MTESSGNLPAKQYAVQLVGPDQLEINRAKDVPQPKSHEILAKVEAVGLCFSDLKLLKQFDQHARKSEIVAGMDPEILAGIQSYVPGSRPTVPGHELVCRVVAIGDAVRQHKVGERCLVQTDYRDLKTAASNAAFGYNFEGGLQEYVIMDERVVTDAKGARFLIPVEEAQSASAIALVEPWACGRLLVVAEPGRKVKGIENAFSSDGPPAELHYRCPDEAQVKELTGLDVSAHSVEDCAALPDEGFDDIIYFGTKKAVIDVLNDKLGKGGIINVVLGGGTIGEPVSMGVGRIHYGLTRWIGTDGLRADESYAMIPKTGEIRANEHVLVVGAGGPMGQMHVLRNLSTGLPGVSVTGTDFDNERLAGLKKKADPIARQNSARLDLVNPNDRNVGGPFSYIAIMAPVPALVAKAVEDSAPGAIINIFAGIPSPVKHDMDLDMIIEKRCFLFGTSGSSIRDMKIVLQKVQSGVLNTNASVDAISGMAGATDGIRAVEERTLAGKIIVYPCMHDTGLIPLDELEKHFPTVAAKLDDGQWTQEAEEELLRQAECREQTE
jgi:threonine dehydrogenase-like Zn-dependent dehydrogenase